VADRSTPEPDGVHGSASVHRSAFVHESAYVDAGATVGSGTKIWHFCHLMAGCRVGADCTVGQNVFIGEDVVVGSNVKIQNNVSLYTGLKVEDDVFLGPSMVFTNVINPRSHVSRKDEFLPTLVKRGATVGANATVVCGLTLGEYCFVGAGAVVTRDVPDHALVHGVPARQRGWVCRCGVGLDFDSGDSAACPACETRYEKQDDAVRVAGRREGSTPERKDR